MSTALNQALQVNWDSVDYFIKQNIQAQSSENGNASKQQERVLLEEREKDELLNEIQNNINSENIITHSAEIISFSTNNNTIANLLDPLSEGLGGIGENNESSLSVASILSLVEKGVSDEELQQILDEAITSTNASIAKDKYSAKKKVGELLTLMAVLERALRQNQQSGQLQNSLKAMQNKISGLLKEGSLGNIQNFLKDNELKVVLKQSISTAAKQPESLKNTAENIGSRIRDNQQLNGLQQNLNQKSEVYKQGQEMKLNGISQLMNKLIDKSKDVLGVNHDVTASRDLRGQNLQPQQNLNSQKTTQVLNHPPFNHLQVNQQTRQTPIQTNSTQTANNVSKPNVTTAYVTSLQQASYSQPLNNEKVRNSETVLNQATKSIEVKPEFKARNQENVIPIRSFANVSEPTIKASTPSVIQPSSQSIQIASLKTTPGQTTPAPTNPAIAQPNTPTPTAGKVLHGPGCPDCQPQVKEADLKKMNVAADTINKNFDPNKRSEHIVEAKSAVGEMKIARAAQGF